MKKPTTISKESVSEYREFVQLRLRKRVLEAIEVVLEERRQRPAPAEPDRARAFQRQPDPPCGRLRRPQTRHLRRAHPHQERIRRHRQFEAAGRRRRPQRPADPRRAHHHSEIGRQGLPGDVRAERQRAHPVPQQPPRRHPLAHRIAEILRTRAVVSELARATGGRRATPWQRPRP